MPPVLNCGNVAIHPPVLQRLVEWLTYRRYPPGIMSLGETRTQSCTRCERNIESKVTVNDILEECRKFIEWAYALLKPKTHNRIALVLIVAGVAASASPVWEPVLRALTQKFFDVSIESPTSSWVGVIIIAMGLIYHYGTMSIESSTQERGLIIQEKQAAHDSEIANEFRKRFSENQKDNLFGRLYNEHACFTDQIRALGDVARLMQSADMHFLDLVINNLTNEFVAKSFELIGFINIRFFVFPRHEIAGRTQLAMQPSWNIDREGSGDPEDMRKYDDLAKELYNFLESWELSYNDLIHSFHERLYVEILIRE